MAFSQRVLRLRSPFGALFQVMNKTKVAAGRTRKANRRRRNGTNGQRGNGASANGERSRGAVRNWRNPGNELDPAIQRYVDLYEFAPIAYVAFDRSGRVRDFNLAATNLLDRKREYLTGSPFSLSVVPADLDLFLRHLARCRAGERRVETNLRLKKHSSEHLSVVLSSTPTTSLIRDGAQLFQTAIIDLTEREQAEARLAEQARLLELSNDAILVRDSHDRIVYWNHGATEIYGYRPEEAIGKVTHDLLRTEHPKPFKGIREKLERDGRWSGEVVHTRKDGTKIAVMSRWALDRDAHGKPVAVLETNTDITERKRAEETIRESEERLRAIINQSNAGMASCDLNGRILFANQTFCKMLGYTQAELTSKTIFTITHPEDVDLTRNRFERMVRKGRPVEMEKRYLRKNGSFIWANVCDTPVLDAARIPVSAVAVAIDITERKRAEAALQRSKELLEKLVRQRTKALRSANAELENEITCRKGLEGQILEISDREQERLSQELHDGLCQQLTAIGFLARASALRLKNHRVVQTDDLEKIAKLINASVMDARNIARDLHKEEIDAAGFLAALEHLADRQIWKTSCRLDLRTEVNIEDDNVASQLYRILREALVNANKHARATQIVLEVRRVKNHLVFSVTDNGVGFSRKPKAGHGLGLHIMQYRAQSIGARLELESPKKRGARVACYLPLTIQK